MKAEKVTESGKKIPSTRLTDEVGESSHVVKNRGFFAIYSKITATANFVSALLICLLMLLINIDILGRYILDSPLPGALEFSEMAMVFIVFLALAYVEARGGNIKVSVFADRFPKRWRSLPDMMNSLVGIFFFILVCWETWKRAIESWQVGEYIEGMVILPVYPSRFIVPVGCALLVVQFVVNLIRSGGTLLGGGEASK